VRFEDKALTTAIPPSKTRDRILVIGGGPAGTAVAIQLARQRRLVTLVEKTATPHDKVCGEFVSGESRRYLDLLGVDIDALGAQPIRAVRVAMDTVIAETRLPFPAWSLRRALLDEALLKRAASEGAHIVRGKRIEALKRQLNVWTALSSDGSSLEADEAFLATGKHDLRGWPRGAGGQNDLLAFKLHFACSTEQQAQLRNCVELIFFTRGYAGLQLLHDGRANLSLLLTKSTFRKCGLRWNDVLDYLLSSSKHLQRRLSGAEALDPRPLALSAIPYGFQRSQTANGPWAIGDQGAVIPSFTGDGIAIALHSAFVAAKAYDRGVTSGDFQRELAHQLRRPIRLATWISQSVVAMPSLVRAIRFCPQILSYIAHATRVPSRFWEPTGPAVTEFTLPC
jgi:menaquinone-9 beta-reductase